MPRILALAALLLVAAPVAAQDRVAQFYAYDIKDRAAFEAGYRKHLQWHAERADKLAWYAWYVTAGDRTGTFIDGTFGATLAQLDARPDPAGDGADFTRTTAAHVTPRAIDTWQLWTGPTSATPYEERQPAPAIDVFLIEVTPGGAATFESAVNRLAANRVARRGSLGWYRLQRGGAAPSYMVIAPRQNWAGISAAGATFADILATTYRSSPAAVQPVLAAATRIRSETWTYAPRLSLIPGRALAQ